MDNKDFDLDEKEESTQEDELVETKEDKDNRKKWLWLLLLLLIFISIGGIYTFSYMRDQRSTGVGNIDEGIDGNKDKDKDKDNNKKPVDDNKDPEKEEEETTYPIEDGYVSVNFDETNFIKLTKAVPLPDAEGLALTGDGLSSFTITNKSTMEVTYEIVLKKVVDKTTLDSGLLDYAIVGKGITPTTSDMKKISAGAQTVLVVNHALKANESRSYDLRIWLDKSVTVANGSGKKFTGIIELNITAPQGGSSLD